MPFFSIVTRTISERAHVLARNQAALQAQTCQDFEQIVLLDTEHLGAAATHLKFHALEPRGEYVWVIDDDDYLADERVLESVYHALRYPLERNMPPFAIVKVKHKWAILPEPEYWDKGAVPLNHIGSSGVVARRDVWMEKRTNWTDWYGGDWKFVESLFKDYAPLWIDRLTVLALQQGEGVRTV